MNYKRHIYGICLLSLLVFKACIPEPLKVEDIPQADKKIVVSSAFIPGQNVALVLTENYGALTGDIEGNAELIEQVLITDAHVRISVLERNYDLLEIQPGLYISNNLIQLNNSIYTLHITDAIGGRRASAETRMIKPINFESVGIGRYITNNDTFPQINYSFRDPPEKNWYMINVQAYRPPEGILESFLDPRVFNRLFTDEGMNDRLISDDFTAFIGREVQPGDSVIVSLANISEDYYNFLNKRNNRFFGIDLLSEPFNLPTNISNGYGFFNLYIPDNRIVLVK